MSSVKKGKADSSIKPTKGYNPSYGIKKEEPDQRGIPKIDNSTIPEGVLPEVQGVIPPNDGRYYERLRILERNHDTSSIRGRSSITTTIEDGKVVKMIPGLSKKYQSKITYNLHDLMAAPPNQLEIMVHQITHDEKLFTITNNGRNGKFGTNGDNDTYWEAQTIRAAEEVRGFTVLESTYFILNS